MKLFLIVAANIIAWGLGAAYVVPRLMEVCWFNKYGEHEKIYLVAFGMVGSIVGGIICGIAYAAAHNFMFFFAIPILAFLTEAVMIFLLNHIARDGSVRFATHDKVEAKPATPIYPMDQLVMQTLSFEEHGYGFLRFRSDGITIYRVEGETDFCKFSERVTTERELSRMADQFYHYVVDSKLNRSYYGDRLVELTPVGIRHDELGAYYLILVQGCGRDNYRPSSSDWYKFFAKDIQTSPQQAPVPKAPEPVSEPMPPADMPVRAPAGHDANDRYIDTILALCSQVVQEQSLSAVHRLQDLRNETQEHITEHASEDAGYFLLGATHYATLANYFFSNSQNHDFKEGEECAMMAAGYYRAALGGAAGLQLSDTDRSSYQNDMNRMELFHALYLYCNDYFSEAYDIAAALPSTEMAAALAGASLFSMGIQSGNGSAVYAAYTILDAWDREMQTKTEEYTDYYMQYIFRTACVRLPLLSIDGDRLDERIPSGRAAVERAMSSLTRLRDQLTDAGEIRHISDAIEKCAAALAYLD